MNPIQRFLTISLFVVGLTLGGLADTTAQSRSAFKVVENMLTLVRTEYIEDVPPSKLIEGAFDNLSTELQKKDIQYDLPEVPEELSPGEAQDFLGETFDQVAAAHPQLLDENWLAHKVIEGMVEGLGDRYTVFMEPDEYRRLKESMSGGNFGGVGIYIQLNPENANRLTVARPIPDTPAADAGLQTGDVILAIDGKSTQGFSIDDAQELLRGRLGSEVTLTIRRLTQARTFDVVLQRDKIRVSSVVSALRTAKGRKVGYVRLQNFGERTDLELETALRELDGQGVEGYLVDLRNNGGGYITSAVDVVSKFLPTGSVVTSVEERGAGNKIYRTRPSLRAQKPLVVLINQYSASASEITAAALADYKRAPLVGVKSFGKGSVQKIFSLPDGSGVKITTAHYHTPTGKDINEVGIEPDVKVEFEGGKLLSKEDTQFVAAAQRLLELIEENPQTDPGLPTARTGAEQWRYLTEMGRGKPEVLSRRYLFGDSLKEEVRVRFPDSTKVETIIFDLGPALGASS